MEGSIHHRRLRFVLLYLGLDQLMIPAVLTNPVACLIAWFWIFECGSGRDSQNGGSDKLWNASKPIVKLIESGYHSRNGISSNLEPAHHKFKQSNHDNSRWSWRDICIVAECDCVIPWWRLVHSPSGQFKGFRVSSCDPSDPWVRSI